MTRRLLIDRLDLDLRGIDPALAEAAVRLLGPALQARLAGTAGRAPAGRDALALAYLLAERVAGQLTERAADPAAHPHPPTQAEHPHAARRID